VKGANILVDSDGRVMVSDFGVALRSSNVTLTADGTVIGTPAFMSPEQCAGRRAGPQSDQYSLGIVAFQMLAGSVPFHGDTLAGMPPLALDARPPAPPPTRPRPRISAGRLAGLAGGGLVALGTIWLLGRPSRLPAPAVSASLDSAAGRPAPAAPSRPAVRRGV